MVRGSLCVGLIVVTLTSVCLAGYPTNRFSIRIPFQSVPKQKSFLSVVDGRVVVAGSSQGRVSDNADAPDRWYIDGTRIKCSRGGGYLAYDSTGKDSTIFVTTTPPEGIEWKIALKRREGSERGVLEAATGAMKGWSLDVADLPPSESGKPSSSASQRVFLTPQPKQPFQVERIFGHK
ncbi:MAG: hypothetical protein HZA46_23245 [Planctomycetales bacterium]|nr:hypothetical protein [Planctomycetales bacterium]